MGLEDGTDISKAGASATIGDVAQLAGVSIKTVSRVLNGEPNVRPKTQDRVKNAIEQLNYQPNPSARGLASRRSHKIALMYDNLMAGSAYIVNIQRGLLQRCREMGYELLIHTLKYHENGIQGIADDISSLVGKTRVDGILLTPPLCDLEAIIHTLDRLQTPYVRLSPGEPGSGAVSVHTNDRYAAVAMTDHLISLGHKRIAYFAGHSQHQAVQQRETGFRKSMANHGLTVDEDLVFRADSRFDMAREAALQLLSRNHLPTAIFAATDEMAAAVLQVAHTLGISVPDQLSVAGFDDSQIASQVWPPLTTIRQPILEMSEVAADLLWDLMRNRKNPVREVALESELVVRLSTGPNRHEQSV